jgi:hypothetical protein
VSHGRKIQGAAVAFAGGATLALLSGCVVQAPRPNSDAAMWAYYLAEREYLGQQAEQYRRERAYEKRFYAPPPVIRAPVTETPPAPAPEIEAAIPDPAPQPAKPAAPRDPACVQWWRICHFL